MGSKPEPQAKYALTGNITELERVRLQSRVWEPAAERLLEAIGVQPGWRCADLGCGPVGIVAPLSRRVGSNGCVVGTDIDGVSLDALREYIASEDLNNVEVVQDDAYASKLKKSSFDLVHVRYLFAPVGRDSVLMKSLLSLCRPGGIIVAQETDTSTWNCSPNAREWDELRSLIMRAFWARGGDFNAGQKVYGLFRQAGLRDVKARAELLCPGTGEPYRRVPLMFATAMRKLILEKQLINEAELDRLLSACDAIAADPERFVTTFTTVQVWGRK